MTLLPVQTTSVSDNIIDSNSIITARDKDKYFKLTLSNLVTTLCWISLILVCLKAWTSIIHDLDAAIALKGFTPIGWMNQLLHPENFARNFPSGTEIMGNSLIMNIYPLAYKFFHISPENLIVYFIGLEIVLTAFIMFNLTKTLVPDAPKIVPYIVAILSVASSARDLNLARFGQPFFVGQFYTIADFLRISAVIFLLKSRYYAAGTFLALSFTIHPVLTITTAAFMFAMQLVQPESFKKRKLWGGAGIFLFVAIAWQFLILKPSTVFNSSFPSQIWYDFTTLCSFHFYPVDLGVFTTQNYKHFVPFLSFILLLWLYMRSYSSKNLQIKQISAGMMMAAGLTLAGILASIYKPSPTLIKLCLHRSSDLMLIFGLPFIVHGLWQEITENAIWRKVFALAVLLSPFYIKPGFPILYSLVLSLPLLIGTEISKQRKAGIASLVIIIITLIIYYLTTGMTKYWYIPGYVGTLPLILASMSIISIYLLLIKRPMLKIIANSLLIICILVVSAFTWYNNSQFNPDYIQRAKAYKEVQLWAKNNTNKQALFMIDPTIHYGWRDYSERSSFGNLKEWLYNWAYSSNYQIYQEGRKRFDEFGIELDPFLTIRPTPKGLALVIKEVQKKYYSANDDWRIHLASKYKIDYFVMEKDKIPTIFQTNLKRIYENDRFLVLSRFSELKVKDYKRVAPYN